jgi:hypothetical protein
VEEPDFLLLVDPRPSIHKTNFQTLQAARGVNQTKIKLGCPVGCTSDAVPAPSVAGSPWEVYRRTLRATAKPRGRHSDANPCGMPCGLPFGCYACNLGCKLPAGAVQTYLARFSITWHHMGCFYPTNEDSHPISTCPSCILRGVAF